MIYTTEMQSQVSQLCAGREAEAPAINADRLDAWKARYPHDVVEIPETKEPPKWPAKRVSIDPPAHITRLPVRARG